MTAPRQSALIFPRRTMCRLLLGLVLAVIPWSPALAAPVGKVHEVQGRATIKRAVDQRTRAVVVQAPLFLRDVLVTAERARLTLLFVDNTQLSVAEDSRLVITAYLFDATKKVRRADLRLISGAIRFTTSKLLGFKDRRFQIKTHTATAGVRGTSVVVEARAGRAKAGPGQALDPRRRPPEGEAGPGGRTGPRLSRRAATG